MISGQFSRFVVVGLLSTIVNYAVFYILLNAYSVPYAAASATGFIVGMLVGFRLNRDWTYKSHARRSDLMKYFVVYLVSLVSGLALLTGLVKVVGMQPEIANVFTIGLTTAMNFLGTKLWVFRA